MKRLIVLFSMIGLLTLVQTTTAQDKVIKDSATTVGIDSVGAAADTMAVDILMADDDHEMADEEAGGGIHKRLKTLFIDGNVFFMSLVALALVLGLAFCIERIIYLTLSEIKTDKFIGDIEKCLGKNDVEGAKQLCRNTRGPVASVCYQGLLHIHQP